MAPCNQFSPAPHYITSYRQFTDHANNPALHVYRGYAHSTDGPVLPPLFSFQVYVTYGDAQAPPTEAATELATSLLGHVASEMQDVDSLRLDVYLLPLPARDDDATNSATTEGAVMAHYRTERAARRGRAIDVPDSYTDDPNGYRALALLVSRVSWARGGGVDVLYFEPPAEVLQRPDRETILGSGVSDDGVRLRRGVALEGSQGLAMTLRTLGESMDAWKSFGEDRQSGRHDKGRRVLVTMVATLYYGR